MTNWPTAWYRSPGVSHSQRSRRRYPHRDRTGDGRRCRHSRCLEALRPHGTLPAPNRPNSMRKRSGPLRRGVGMAGMWYGCGNTSLPNPSTVRVGLKPDGSIALHQGAVDIGQGSNTIVTQICADAMGAPIERFDLVSGDTAITPDCGKTSASRQTFVTGKAAHMAGVELRQAILNWPEPAPAQRFYSETATYPIKDRGQHHARSQSGETPTRQIRLHCDRRSHVRSSDQCARRERPRHSLRRLRVWRTHGGDISRCGTRHCACPEDYRGARCWARHQSDADRRADRRRRRARPRHGADGGILSRQRRESSRLPDSYRRRHAARGIHSDRRSFAHWAVWSERNRRAGRDPNCTGNPECDPRCHRRPCSENSRPRPDRIRAPRFSSFAKEKEAACLTTTPSVAMPAPCSATSSPDGRARATATAIDDGQLVRIDPHVVLDRALSRGDSVVPFLDRDREWDGNIVSGPETFVTAIGAGTTYPDYKPAPFIISSEVAGRRYGHGRDRRHFQLLRRESEDRHRPPPRPRAQHRARARESPSDTSRPASMVRRCFRWAGFGISPEEAASEGTVTCETLLNLCNGKPVELDDR